MKRPPEMLQDLRVRISAVPGISGAAGGTLLMVLRSGAAGSSPERGPGQMGAQGWGGVCSGWTPRFPQGRLGHQGTVSAWPQLPLLAPTWGEVIPLLDSTPPSYRPSQ